MKIIKLFPQKLATYKGIEDLPVFNWFKIQDTNDLSWLLMERHDINEKQRTALAAVMDVITCEYIDHFGINDNYKKKLELDRDIRVLEIRLMRTKDLTHETFLQIKRLELKTLTDQQTASDSAIVTVHAKKYMGGNLNMRETSVKEFYTIIQEIKREARLSHERSN